MNAQQEEALKERYGGHKIIYRSTTSIPEDIISSFLREAGGGSDLMSRILRSTIKLAAFNGSAMAGYLSADYWSHVISIHGLYVRPEFRGRGIARRLLYRTIMRAKQEKLEGVDIDNMVWDSIYVLRNIKSRCQKNHSLEIREVWGDDEVFGEIRFRQRGLIHPV